MNQSAYLILVGVQETLAPANAGAFANVFNVILYLAGVWFGSPPCNQLGRSVDVVSPDHGSDVYDGGTKSPFEGLKLFESSIRVVFTVDLAQPWCFSYDDVEGVIVPESSRKLLFHGAM